jgi:tetratricopeptide (TPR) repeat protein
VLKLVDETQAKLPDSKMLLLMLRGWWVQAMAHLDPAKVQPRLDSDALDKSIRGGYFTAASSLIDVRSLDKHWSELALSYLDKADAVDPSLIKRSRVMRFVFYLVTDDAKALELWEASDTQKLKLIMATNIMNLDNVGKPWMERVVVYMKPLAEGEEGDDAKLGGRAGGGNYWLLGQAYFGLGRAREAVAAQKKFLAFMHEKGATASDLEPEEARLKTYQAAVK